MQAAPLPSAIKAEKKGGAGEINGLMSKNWESPNREREKESETMYFVLYRADG